MAVAGSSAVEAHAPRVSPAEAVAALPEPVRAMGQETLYRTREACLSLQAAGGKWEGPSDHGLAGDTELTSPPRWLWGALGVICPKEHAAAVKAVDNLTAETYNPASALPVIFGGVDPVTGMPLAAGLSIVRQMGDLAFSAVYQMAAAGARYLSVLPDRDAD